MPRRHQSAAFTKKKKLRQFLENQTEVHNQDDEETKRILKPLDDKSLQTKKQQLFSLETSV